MKVVVDNAELHFAEALKTLESTGELSQWRCVVTNMSEDLYLHPQIRKDIIAKIQDLYKGFEIYEMSFYWVETGHVFLLFQGRTIKVQQQFDVFLNFLSDLSSGVRPSMTLMDLRENLMDVLKLLQGAVIIIKERLGRKRQTVEQLEAAKVYDEDIVHLRKRDHQRKLRIRPLALVVEDELLSQSFLKAILEPLCDVEFAATVADAYVKYCNLWPNLVFMDLHLPDGDGQELTEELCQMDPFAYVTLVSANISMDRLKSCREMGVQGFVAKPVTQEKSRIVGIVNNYISYKDHL